MYDDEEEGKSRKKKFLTPLITYISESKKYAKLRLYDKAITTLDAALEDYPDNVQLLVDRAACLLRLGKNFEAKKDLEVALQINPKNTRAITLHGEAKYFVGDFECGYLTFNKARADRRNLQPARLGKKKCKLAINNTLDDKTMYIDTTDEVGDLLSAYQKHERRLAKRSKRFRDDEKFLKLVLAEDYMDLVHPRCKDLLQYLKEREELSRMEDPDTRRKVFKPFPVIVPQQRKSKSSVCDASTETDDVFSTASENNDTFQLTCKGLYFNRLRFKYREGSESSSAQDDFESVQSSMSEEREDGFRDIGVGTEEEPVEVWLKDSRAPPDVVQGFGRRSSGASQNHIFYC